MGVAMTEGSSPRREPVYRELERYLREEIRADRLRPGDQLPSEPELAARHGMARMTARRAIEALLSDGLLVRRRGRGTFVASPRLAYPPATSMSFSRTMAALGHDVTTRLLDFLLTELPADIAQDLDLPTGSKALLVRRLRFVAGEPVAIHMNYMDGSYFELIRASDLLTRPISDAMQEASGVHVASSRDYLEGAPAPREEAALLHIDAGDPVLLVIGLAYSDDGVPVLATRGWYRADRFRFAVGVRGLGLSFELSR
jgi:GntR family transcriptional regulator